MNGGTWCDWTGLVMDLGALICGYSAAEDQLRLDVVFPDLAGMRRQKREFGLDQVFAENVSFGLGRFIQSLGEGAEQRWHKFRDWMRRSRTVLTGGWAVMAARVVPPWQSTIAFARLSTGRGHDDDFATELMHLLGFPASDSTPPPSSWVPDEGGGDYGYWWRIASGCEWPKEVYLNVIRCPVSAGLDEATDYPRLCAMHQMSLLRLAFWFDDALNARFFSPDVAAIAAGELRLDVRDMKAATGRTQPEVAARLADQLRWWSFLDASCGLALRVPASVRDVALEYLSGRPTWRKVYCLVPVTFTKNGLDHADAPDGELAQNHVREVSVTLPDWVDAEGVEFVIDRQRCDVWYRHTPHRHAPTRWQIAGRSLTVCHECVRAAIKTTCRVNGCWLRCFGPLPHLHCDDSRNILLFKQFS